MHKKHLITATLIGFIGLSGFSHASDHDVMKGVPVVEDSGTLLINGQKINLWGISTLAPDQQCWEGSDSWCCGEAATMALRHFIHGREVSCTLIEKGTEHAAPKATCLKKGLFREKDIARFLVIKGLALDSSGAYKIQQKKAQKKKRGIWSGRFQTAQDWKDGIERYRENK